MVEVEINLIIQSLVNEIGYENIKYIYDTSENDLDLLHFSLGLHIRNKYLHCNEDIKNMFYENKIYTVDDMSSYIIKELYYFINLKQR